METDKYMDNENIMDLDTEWIEEFETLDEQYKMFYKENITNIKCTYVYVNKDNDIGGTKEETIILKQTNHVSREEIVEIIKKNSCFKDKSYSVLSILKYNFDIEPSDIPFYAKERKTTTHDESNFLTLIKSIDIIPLNKTIYMFQDLNEIIIIFYEKTFHKNNMTLTKKIYIHNKNNSNYKKRKTYRKKT
jgi:hypothetical protein|uniref:Uncharacterized protein n=1 Tax=viral metagenome TaxID=1070528 RepID=A0A6C0D7H3_9ZZZZ